MFPSGGQAGFCPVLDKLCSRTDGGLLFTSILQAGGSTEGRGSPSQRLNMSCRKISACKQTTHYSYGWHNRSKAPSVHHLPSSCEQLLSSSRGVVEDGRHRGAASVPRFSNEIAKGDGNLNSLQGVWRIHKGQGLQKKQNCKRGGLSTMAVSTPRLGLGHLFLFCDHCRGKSLCVYSSIASDSVRKFTSANLAHPVTGGGEVEQMFCASVGSTYGSRIPSSCHPSSCKACSRCRSTNKDDDFGASILDVGNPDGDSFECKSRQTDATMMAEEGQADSINSSREGVKDKTWGVESSKMPSRKPSDHSSISQVVGGEETEDEQEVKEGGKTADLAMLQTAVSNGEDVLWALQRWTIPWTGNSTALGMVGWLLSFVVTGYGVSLAVLKLGLRSQLSTDPDLQSLFLFFNQSIQTIVGVLTIALVVKPFEPLPDDLFVLDVRRPRFTLKNGWLLWVGIGLAAAVVAVQVSSQVVTFFHGGELPPREKNEALMQLLPLIGVSGTTTLSLLAVTGVCAPLLEEVVFRGFLLTSLTKWFPTPLAILLSSSAFAAAHFTPSEFPQLFSLGLILGFTYARTRNLLTPMIIHSLWNSSVLLLLTLLRTQGYNISDFINQ